MPSVYGTLARAGPRIGTDIMGGPHWAGHPSSYNYSGYNGRFGGGGMGCGIGYYGNGYGYGGSRGYGGYGSGWGSGYGSGYGSGSGRGFGMGGGGGGGRYGNCFGGGMGEYGRSYGSGARGCDYGYGYGSGSGRYRSPYSGSGYSSNSYGSGFGSCGLGYSGLRGRRYGTSNWGNRGVRMPFSRSRYGGYTSSNMLDDDWDDDFNILSYRQHPRSRRRGLNDWSLIRSPSSYSSFARVPRRLPPLYTGARRGLLGRNSGLLGWDDDDDEDWLDIDEDEDDLDLEMEYLGLDDDGFGFAGGGRRRRYGW